MTLVAELSDVDTIDDVDAVRRRLPARQPVRARPTAAGTEHAGQPLRPCARRRAMLGPPRRRRRPHSCRCAAGSAAGTPTRGSTGRCLELCEGPTIDLGCGPGRLVAELIRRGVPALGVDQSATAVGLARRSGAPALRRDVFGPLPGAGRWQTVLLADGNVGLGGDPLRVLRRAAELLGRGGRVHRRIRCRWQRVCAPAGSGSSRRGRSGRGFAGRRSASTARPSWPRRRA